MSTSIADIKDRIVGKLELMTNINSVFGYATSNIDGAFATAGVTLEPFDGEIRANTQNLMTYRFKISVAIQFGEAGFTPEDSEERVIAIADEVVTAFSNDTTLSGIVNWCLPISGNPDWSDREMDTRTLDIILECNKLESTQGTAL